MRVCPGEDLVKAARGLVPADTVFKNARIFNPFTCGWDEGTLAVKDGTVVGIGDYAGRREYDFRGSCIIPGLIDAHVHIESSLLTPHEYARLVAMHGTTTVIADPHEIANVAGTKGLDYMLARRKGAAIDIRYLLPSCVPSTPADTGGAVLDAGALRPYARRAGIIGLGEMMDTGGVLKSDPGVMEKWRLSRLREGHAPLMTGRDLNAYILCGFQSDHECTGREEAEEKLRQGMYIYIREGSIEQDIAALIDLVTPATVSRCCFATDDCHADLLCRDGHIDRCIRHAVESGLAPELAIRMATLSPAERFSLTDRGALAPGRRADFCVIDDPMQFTIRKVFVSGTERQEAAYRPPPPFTSPFPRSPPLPADITIDGCGIARVIGLMPMRILTTLDHCEVSGDAVPDTARDILKVVVCSRYRKGEHGIGLVHGLGLKEGALASSISHDAHNIIAAGTDDREILRAIREVIRLRGGMVAVRAGEATALPLGCGGLMSPLPYPEVVARIEELGAATDAMGAIHSPFMYLSFLALPVLPALRITSRGLFDAGLSRHVPLFTD